MNVKPTNPDDLTTEQRVKMDDNQITQGNQACG